MGDSLSRHRHSEAASSHQAASAAAGEARDLAPLLESLRAAHKAPALAAAVVDGSSGALLAVGAVGHRVVGDGHTAVSCADRWHLGSATKAMTATLVARLVERGLLGWDSRLDALLPAAWSATMRADYAGVTPVHLLSHRAGLPGDLVAVSGGALWNELWRADCARDVQQKRRTFTEQLLALPPAQSVGTHVYSNGSYIVMGAVLEALTGRLWEELMQAEVFAPLGMTSVGFGMPGAADRHGKCSHPRGHRMEHGRLQAVHPGPGDDNPKALGPAGTVHATLADWGRFVAAHVAGARQTAAEPVDAGHSGRGDAASAQQPRDGGPGPAPGPFLSTRSWQMLHTVPDSPADADGYALGWVVNARSWARGTVLTHNGSNTMNYCVVWAAPALDRGFLACTNMGDGHAVTDAAVSALIQLKL